MTDIAIVHPPPTPQPSTSEEQPDPVAVLKMLVGKRKIKVGLLLSILQYSSKIKTSIGQVIVFRHHLQAVSEQVVMYADCR